MGLIAFLLSLFCLHAQAQNVAFVNFNVVPMGRKESFKSILSI